MNFPLNIQELRFIVMFIFLKECDFAILGTSFGEVVEVSSQAVPLIF